MNTVTLDYYKNEHGPYIIDLARDLSLVNRKSFRSGYVYSVDFIEYIGEAGDVITIGKIPETYCTARAYTSAFQAWKAQRHQTMEESDVIESGKWADFKPYFDVQHKLGNRTNLIPRGITGLTGATGELDTTGREWNRATIVVNDVAAATTTNYEVGMLGDDDTANGYVSIMDAYGDTRSATLAPDPLIPDASVGSWIMRTGEASGEFSGDVIDLIDDENDLPPYANQTDVSQPPTYVGNGQSAPMGMLVDYGTAGTTGRPLVLDGGLIPLGLLTVATAGTGDWRLRVHCTRGEYKGAVAALPMGDFS